MRVVSSAPGKLVLLGEYAVLEGAPALAMAANRRAMVVLDEAADHCVIHAPSLGIANAHCRFVGGQAQWSNVSSTEADRLALVGAIIASTMQDKRLSPFRARLDTDAFFSRAGGAKLGLGSSAALTVALTGAICARQGQPVPDAPTLIATHRKMQNGRGSGVDIATSLRGGAIGYRLGDADLRVEPLVLPARLEIACVWSGKSASTANFLARIAAWKARSPSDYKTLIKRLAVLSSAGVDAVRGADVTAILDAAAAYAQTLSTLGQASDINIVTPEHVKIAQIAACCGVIYKTCGAGGGDIGIALTDDRSRMIGFCKRLESTPFTVLDINRDDVGLQTNTATGEK